MVKVVIYTMDYCPYCKRAKALLDKKNVPYDEIDVTNDPAMQEKLEEMTGGMKTVPQIFIDGNPVGGCTDLERLNASGQLDVLLAQ